MYSPHSFRHAAAGHMTKNGADIRAVQCFLGHKDVGSTEVYVDVDNNDLRNVMNVNF